MEGREREGKKKKVRLKEEKESVEVEVERREKNTKFAAPSGFKKRIKRRITTLIGTAIRIENIVWHCVSCEAIGSPAITSILRPESLYYSLLIIFIQNNT